MLLLGELETDVLVTIAASNWTIWSVLLLLSAIISSIEISWELSNTELELLTVPLTLSKYPLPYIDDTVLLISLVLEILWICELLWVFDLLFLLDNFSLILWFATILTEF